jgi:hypothetical protein
MSVNRLSLSNIVNISVATAPAGLQDYKINNLLYITKEVPVIAPAGDYAIYLDPTAVATDWGIASETYQAAVAVFSQSPNILDGGGAFIVAPMVGGDTISIMLAKISAEIFFGGMLYGGYAPLDAEVLAGAAATQAAKKILFSSQDQLTAIGGGGVFTLIQAAAETYTRCLLYTVSPLAARLMAAAYASRLMSVDFNGSQTTSTMHMKDLVGVTPDPGITQATLTTCQTVGADVYTYFGPLPKVFSAGGNTYADQVYGTLWLIFALQVAGFNAIATIPTKLPQTEAGMAILRNNYTAVLQQAVTNGFAAPGAWNSAQLFGNPTDLKANVLQRGFYVYSAPVNSQSQSARVARQAPLVQIALKLAGAIHSTSVVVYINP